MKQDESLVWTTGSLASPHDAPDKAGRIRRMFNAIAPRYELVNSVFSGGRDAVWRRKAVALAAVRCDDDVLDIACGTGDFARAFAAAGPRSLVGCDFAHEMLIRAAARPVPPCRWCEGDALRLPFGAGGFSIVSCAFGVRNFADLDGGLKEMYRVLRPGGRAVILEFTRPQNRLVRAVYEFYCRKVMPVVASLLSGDKTGAYRYLPRSVVTFADARQMSERLAGTGFSRVIVAPFTLGAVTICLAYRS